MTHITAGDMHFKALNDLVRDTADDIVVIDRCLGQRYIGSGLSHKKLVINGTPGNALGAYLDGCLPLWCGESQDATGDTMNDGVICIHGCAGDATGYAMRGGTILVEGSTGYRAGIHMKAYEHRLPTLVIGGKAGSFLGEYQAGGLIVVLNLTDGDGRFSCNFCGTGMHGGKIVVRCREMARGSAAPAIGQGGRSGGQGGNRRLSGSVLVRPSGRNGRNWTPFPSSC